MKKELLIVLILGLSIGTVLPVEAQQRSSSSRRSQARTAAANSASDNDGDEATATAVESKGPGVPRVPEVPGSPGAPGAPGVPRVPGAPRVGGFSLMGLQMQAREEASDEDGNVKVDVFLASFMKAAKAADSDGDGKLTEEELGSLMPRRPDGPGRQGEGRSQGRESGSGDTSMNESGMNVVRSQEANRRGNTRRGATGDNGEGAQSGPRGFGGPQRGMGPGGFGAFGPGAPGQNPLLKAITDSIDEQDGSVNLEKLEKALKSALDEADANDDGSLDAGEWRSFTGGFGGMGFGGFNGFGAPPQNPNPNAFRAMQILSLQREAQAAALGEDGKLNIEKFRSEFVKLLKEADSNNDGVLKEDELQAMQQKAMEKMQEEMRERMRNGGGPQGGMGFGGFGGRGPGQGNPFDQFKNDQGEIELSKLEDVQLPDQLKQDLKSADADNNGVLSEEELNKFQEEMRARFQNFGPRGGMGFGGQGGPRGNAPNGNQGQNPRNNSSYTPVFLEEGVVLRGQEASNNEVGQGNNRSDRGGRSDRGEGGFGRGGMGGPGMPGMGFPGGGFGRGGMSGFGFGMPGMGGFGMPGMGGFGGGSDAVLTAATKAMNDDGEFNIANFDTELGKLLSDSDNEDDGALDSLEQTDAFGRVLGRSGFGGPQGGRPQGERGGRGPQGDRPQGERGGRGPQGDRPQGERGGRDFQGREAEFEEMMRARSLPTPDSALFVAVPANENFKFSKPFEKDGTAEKTPIEADYAIGKYEVRNREYKEFVDATKRTELPKTWVDGTYPKGTKNCPVVGVTVKDAEDYCEWLATKYEGWSFRLPTEAEFENAAAGPQKQLFPWGKTSGFAYSRGELTANCQYNAQVVAELIAEDASATIDDKSSKVKDLVTITNKGVLSKGWRDSKAKTGFTYSKEFLAKSKVGGYTVPVYKFQENRSPYGCIGMSGNAAEWTSTVFDGKNVIRGGSWYSSPEECSATYRGETQDPSRGTPTVGFRVVAEQI